MERETHGGSVVTLPPGSPLPSAVANPAESSYQAVWQGCTRAGLCFGCQFCFGVIRRTAPAPKESAQHSVPGCHEGLPPPPHIVVRWVSWSQPGCHPGPSCPRPVSQEYTLHVRAPMFLAQHVCFYLSLSSNLFLGISDTNNRHSSL